MQEEEAKSSERKKKMQQRNMENNANEDDDDDENEDDDNDEDDNEEEDDDENAGDDNDDEDEEESDGEEGNNNNKLTSRDIEIIQSVIDVDEDDEVVFDVADFSAKNIISQNQIVDDIKYVLNINLLPLSFFIHSTPNFLICEFFYIF
jgi:hypothetical protein